MKGYRKQLNERMAAFREDYRKANARINFLLANDDRGEELERLERFVGYVDNMVECFPERQRQIIRLCVLDDIPVTSAAIEVGYHYTWAIQLRDNAVQVIEEVLDGTNIVQSKLGLEIMERLDAFRDSICRGDDSVSIHADPGAEPIKAEHL